MPEDLTIGFYVLFSIITIILIIISYYNYNKKKKSNSLEKANMIFGVIFSIMLIIAILFFKGYIIVIEFVGGLFFR